MKTRCLPIGAMLAAYLVSMPFGALVFQPDAPFQALVKSHMALIEEFPNREPGLPEEAGLTPHD